MDRDDIIYTLKDIIDYFEHCLTNSDPVSTGRRRYRKYIAALRECIVDQAAAQMYEEDDGR